MKKLRVVMLIFLANLLISSAIYAQTKDTASYNLNVQLGASTRLGMPANSWSVIPEVGLDFNSGMFGIRATGQFFESSPEFDIDAYLAPISSHISQSGTKKHSNILLGISPYLNLPQRRFTVQPSLGLQYLMQTGATLMANYGDLNPGAILNAANGKVDRSVFLIKPNVRVLFGKENFPLLFFVEAGYSMVASVQEYTITSRNLDGVILADGAIDHNLMQIAATDRHTEDIMLSSLSFSVGIELNILGGPRRITAPPTSLFSDYSDFGFNSQNDTIESDRCCDNIVVHEPVIADGNCCYVISYDLNVDDDCVLDKVIFNALDNKQISVNYDLFGSKQSDCVSQHIVQQEGAILPFGPNHFLAEICACPVNGGDVEVEIVFMSSNAIVCRDTVVLKCYQEPVHCMCKFQEIRVDGKYSPANSSIDLKIGDTKHFELSGFCYPEDSCESNYWWTVKYPDGSTSAKDYTKHEDVTFNQVGTYELTACIECQDSLETCCETIFVNVEK